jgi:hypothetical protein
VTAAVPPIASMLGLFVLLRTLHRIITSPADVVETAAPVVEGAAGAAPSQVLDVEGFAEDAEPVDPAQRLREEIASSILSAKAAGLAYDTIKAELPANVYQVKKIIKPLLEPAEPEPVAGPVEINGHELELA